MNRPTDCVGQSWVGSIDPIRSEFVAKEFGNRVAAFEVEWNRQESKHQMVDRLIDRGDVFQQLEDVDLGWLPGDRFDPVERLDKSCVDPDGQVVALAVGELAHTQLHNLFLDWHPESRRRSCGYKNPTRPSSSIASAARESAWRDLTVPQ